MKKDMIAKEYNFKETMSTVIEPWARAHLKDGYIESFDGMRIHYAMAVHPEERAAVVISHGFCEFIPKYYEMIYYFYSRGYSVFMPEYRGHGFSQRAGAELERELDKVHVGDYREYVEDLHSFVDKVVAVESRTKKLILFAHSMGGCIASLFLEQYPKIFDRAILSSPLLEMNFRGVSPFKVRLLFAVSTVLKWDMKYVPGQHGFDDIYAFSGSSCLSESRYSYVFSAREREPRYTTYGGTYGWTRASVRAIDRAQKNAAEIEIPVLLFQAGLDTMVRPEGQNRFVSKIPSAELIRYDDSKHEIFNSVDDIIEDYYDRIFAFMENI